MRAPPGTIGACSPSGWINSDLFVLWLKHFIKSCNARENPKTVLLLDNHESHISLDAFELCQSKRIILVSFAPHTSHRCQPLDLTVYGPLKTAYYKRCTEWMNCNVGKRITDDHVAQLFSEAYCKIATVDKCLSGFRTAGIWPMNSSIFCDEDFAAADQLLHDKYSVAPSFEQSLTATSIEQPVTSSVVEQPTTSSNVEQPMTSSTVEQPTTSSTIGQPTTSDDATNVLFSSTSTPAKSNETISHKRISVNDISPIPRPDRKETSRKSRQKRSEILTE